MVNNIVTQNVFSHFERGEFTEGESILRRLSFKLTQDNTTEEHRIVLYNLAWVLEELGRIDLAKDYIIKIKDIIEKDIEYMENNVEKYQMVLGLYSELFKDELTTEDKIDINKRKYEACCGNIDFLDQALSSKFNIYSMQDDYEGMVDCVESIHNYVMTEIYIDKTKEESDRLREKLKEVKTYMLEELKMRNKKVYDEICEEIINLTNSFIAI